MDDVNLASTKWKLVLTGVAVVLSSVVMSLVATHLSFQMSGSVEYGDSMLTALIIPLLVAPPSYGYVAWLSWKLKIANERLDELAHRDPLTSLYNRRAFVDAATKRLAGGGGQMLAMIDIDHFKRINDRLGHAGGDMALQHAAELLRRSAPQDALLGRLGGEEFGLLFAVLQEDGCGAETGNEAGNGDAGDSATAARVEAMRQQLESMPLITPQGLIHITASFGLAIARADETLDTLLSRADMALYAAKHAGRNRLHLAQ